MKKKKLIALFSSIIICLINTFSWAGVLSEIPSAPASLPSGDGASPGGSGSSFTEDVVFVIEKTEISGQVYEDLRRKEDDYNTNGEKDDNESGIPGVIVQLLDTDGRVVRTTYTGQDGKYSFTGLGGTYKLRFIYGLVDQDSYLSDDTKGRLALSGDYLYPGIEPVRVMMKYNGQDYQAQFKDGKEDVVMSSYKEIIRKKQKTASQIFLLVDQSGSMRETLPSGETGTDIAKRVAHQVTDQLLGENNPNRENIYIGIIGFGGDAVVRKQLSNNYELVSNAIDNIDNLGEGEDYGAYTDMASAMNKAMESFAGTSEEDSNRTMILLSDGVPSKYESKKEAPIATVKATGGNNAALAAPSLTQVADLTNERMRNIVSSGVRMTTIIPENTDPFEQQLLNRLTDSSKGDIGQILKPDRLEDVINQINQEVSFETITTTENEVTKIIRTNDIGIVDNQARRDEVNQLFGDPTYGIMYNTIDDLEKCIENRGVTSEDIKNMMEKTYMFVETGAYEFFVSDPGDTEGKTVITIPEPYTDRDLLLSEREPTSLEPNIKLTGLRITMSDGQILKNEANENGIGNMGGSIGSFVYNVDTELMQGATIQLEYTIGVKNTSTAWFNSFSLVDYLQTGLYMDPEAVCISDNRFRNRDYGWSNIIATNGTAYPMANIDVNTPALQGKASYDETTGKYYITKGGEQTDIKIVLQTVVGAGQADLNYDNSVEILAYRNSDGRRMGRFPETAMSPIVNCEYIKPSNQVESEFDFCSTSHNNGSLIIIPPTGVWNNYTLTIVTLIACISTIVWVQTYKKKNMKKDTRRRD